MTAPAALPPARTVCTLGLCVLLALAAVPGSAVAQQQRSSGTVVVGADETVEGNLDAFGASVIVRGTVTGDVNAFAGNVRIEGTVEGDVAAAAGNVVVGPNASVGGTLDVTSGTVTVAGSVGENVNAAAESVSIAGTVGGNVEAAAATVTLASTADVAGDVTYGGELVREEGAQVGGSVREGGVNAGPVAGEVTSLPGVVLGVYGLLVNAALGVLLLLVFPQFSRALASRARTAPLRSGGTGLLMLLGVPVVLALIALTIVGIPLTIAGFFAFLLVLWIAAVYGRYAIGAWLVGLVGFGNRWAGLLVGLVAVALLKRIPFASGLVELLVLLLGLGALSLTLYGRYRGERRPASATESGSDEETMPA